MSILSRAASAWRTLFRGARLERELDDEIQAAIETLADRYERQGMEREAARRAARRALGGVDQVKEAVRDTRIGARLDTLRLDLRYAWRGLAHAPGFTAIITLTLALGIGANTAIFSLVQTVLLAPLPFRAPDRLVFVWSDMSARGYPRAPLSGPELWDLRAGSRTCAAFGAIWANGATLTGGGEAEQLQVGRVTPDFFDVLGAEPALGRTFRAEDGAHGAAPTILIAWDLFQRRFGADPAIVGRRILVNDEPTTVIGVMPRGFRLLLPTDASVPDRLQAWMPFWSTLEERLRGQQFLRVIGRMRPGVPLAAAREEIAGIARRISRTFPEYGDAGRAFETVLLADDHVREIRAPLLALFAAVGLLLAIACVNVASLLIARAAARTRETTLRLALGASRGRVIAQALVEGLLLTTLGAAAGLAVGHAVLRALQALRPEALDRLGSSRIDLTVLAFTLAIAVAWGLLFSLAPLTELVRSHGSAAGRALQPRGRTVSTRLPSRTRATLVIAQVALSLVLLVCAGLLVRTFVEEQRLPRGFRAEGALTFRTALPLAYSDSPEAFNALTDALEQRLAALPGVTGVGIISHLPFDDLPNWFTSYGLLQDAAGPSGERPDADGQRAIAAAANAAPRADTRAISPGLFETIGASLVEGRTFTHADRDPAQIVVIVDDRLARRMWPGRRALGQQLAIDPGTTGVPTLPATVVGVVRHLALRGLTHDRTEQIFIPQFVTNRNPMALVVKTTGDVSALASDVRAAVAGLDPRLPVYDARPLDTYVEAAHATRRFTMVLAAAFAAAALGLTCVGVYGLLACAVAHRRHEIGVRRALGAGAGQVMWAILGEGVRLALAGCVCGLGGALLAARLMRSQLDAVHPGDPAIYAIAILLILCGAALACWIPARRALAVSPIDALRLD